MDASRLLRCVRRLRERAAGEGGAVMPLAAGFVVVAVTAAAFSVDLGQLAAEKRDLRSVTDIVALDATRRVATPACALDELPPETVVPPELPAPEAPFFLAGCVRAGIEAQAFETARRNGYDPVDATTANAMTLELGVWSRNPLDTDLPPAFHPCPEAIEDVCPVNAVRARLTTHVDRAFAYFHDGDTVELEAIALNTYAGSPPLPPADPSPTPPAPVTEPPTPPPAGGTLPPPGSTILARAGMTVGSFVARLETGGSPVYDAVLNGLLGIPGSASVTGVGYSGLAQTQVGLGDVAAALGAGTVDDLLDAEVTVADVLEATATAMDGGGPVAVTAASDLVRLAAGADPGLSFRFGDLVAAESLSGSVGEEGAASLVVRSGDLLLGAAQAGAAAALADGGSAVSVALPVSGTLLGLGVLSLQLHVAVVEPPVFAFGEAVYDLARPGWLTSARTAQVRTVLTVELASAAVPGATSNMRLPLAVAAGRARADLVAVACHPERSTTRHTLDVYRVSAQTAASELVLGDVTASALGERSSSLGAVATTASVGTMNVSLGGLLGSTVSVEVLGHRVASVGGAGPETLSFADPWSSPVQSVGAGLAAGAAGGAGDLLFGSGTSPAFSGRAVSTVLGLTADLTVQSTVAANMETALAPLEPELDALLASVDTALGVRIGGADVSGMLPECPPPVVLVK